MEAQHMLRVPATDREAHLPHPYGRYQPQLPTQVQGTWNMAVVNAPHQLTTFLDLLDPTQTQKQRLQLKMSALRLPFRLGESDHGPAAKLTNRRIYISRYKLAFPLAFDLNKAPLRGSTVVGKETRWFASSSEGDIQLPPILNPQLGDLWRHLNTTSRSFAYWLYASKKTGWQPVSIGPKVLHPAIQGRYLRVVETVPEWVVKTTWEKWRYNLSTST